MVKRVNSKNTKAEILDAFAELKKEKTALEAQIKQLNQTKPSSPTTKPTVSQPQNTKKVMPSSPQTMEKTLTSLETLQINFGSAVSNLSEQLLQEVSSLEELQTTIAEERQQLKDLHDLEELEDNTLDNLITAYEENAKVFGEEFSEQKETLEQQIQDLKKTWKKEQENYQRALKERNENSYQVRQRDQEEYQYNLELERNLDQEEYEHNKKELEKELEESRQEQEKQWEERETSIAEQEKTYNESKEKVEAFEEELKKNTEKGKQNGKNIGNYQAKIKADLRGKEIEGEKQNFELQIEAFQDTLETQEERIQSLTQQLDMAQKQVQDLAVKAIEGTANRKSFEAMKELAMEQAKTQQKGK